jgi:acyl carrier protein
MTRQELTGFLCEAFELPPGSFDGQQVIRDVVEWNSLAVIGLMALVDEHCGVTLSPERVIACTSVDELLALTSPKTGVV